MTFPDDQLPLLVELKVGAEWVDITADVRTQAGITITRGRGDEAAQMGPCSCQLTVDNRGGQFSPRNPTGPYYGRIGRNTQLRLSLIEDPVFTGSTISPSGAGDLSWTHTPTTDPQPSGVIVWVMQATTIANQVASVTYGGVPMVNKGIQGTSPAGTYYRYELVGVKEIPPGLQTVLVDVTGGSTKRAIVVTFSGGEECVITASGTKAFLASSNPTIDIDVEHSGWLLGYVYSSHDAIGSVTAGTGFTEMQDTDFGTEVWSPIRGTTGPVGPGTHQVRWTSAASDWTGEAFAVEARSYRFWGEIAELPPRWDTSLREAWVPITANGILRRLGQGNAPANVGLRSFVSSWSPWAYWPLDDGPLAGHGTNEGFVSQHNFFRFPGAGSFAPRWEWAKGELAPGYPPTLSVLETDVGASWPHLRGDVAIGTWAETVTVDYLFRAEVLGPLTMNVRDYNDNEWQIALRGDGVNDDIRLAIIEGVNSGGVLTTVADTGTLSEITDGDQHHVRFVKTQNGGNIDWEIWLDGTLRSSGTRAVTSGGCAWVAYTYTPTDPDTAVALGHVVVYANDAPPIDEAFLASALFSGETAGRRIERVCGELGVPFLAIGDLDDTELVGPQLPGTALQHMRDAVDVDGGTLYEARNELGLIYRTRVTTYNQDPVVVDVAAGELAPELAPTDDDQLTRNDVTAKRPDGGSYRAVLEEGPLSIEDPPDGVGRYETEVTLNVASDEQLRDQAFWRLRQGTIDESRYPVITVERAAPDVIANPVLSLEVLALDVDDAIALANAQELNIADQVAAIVRGYSEYLMPKTHQLAFNCSPAAPFEVATYASDVATDGDRYSPDDCWLWEALDTVDTSLVVGVPTGPGWTDADGAYDVMVGGERMTVTSVQGGDGSPFFAGTGTGDSQNNAPVTAGMPATALAGDLVLIFASIRNSGTGTPNTPANWSLLLDMGNARLFSRVWDGVWTMPTITFTGGAAGEDTIAQSCAFRGLTHYDAEVQTQLNASGQHMAIDAFGPLNGLTRAILYLGWKQDDWTSVLPPVASTLINSRVGTALDAGQSWAVRFVDDQSWDVPAAQFTVTGGAAAISRTGLVMLQLGQILNVTRSVNGVVKSHLGGDRVRLAKPAYYAL